MYIYILCINLNLYTQQGHKYIGPSVIDTEGCYNNNNNIYLLQLGCYPVAMVILHVNKTLNWLLLNLSREGYIRNMQWQIGILGTISAFAFRHREIKKTLCRDGLSQHKKL